MTFDEDKIYAWYDAEMKRLREKGELPVMDMLCVGAAEYQHGLIMTEIGLRLKTMGDRADALALEVEKKLASMRMEIINKAN